MSKCRRQPFRQEGTLQTNLVETERVFLFSPSATRSPLQKPLLFSAEWVFAGVAKVRRGETKK